MTGLQYLFVVILGFVGLALYGGFHPLAVDLVNLLAPHPSPELVAETEVGLYFLAAVLAVYGVVGAIFAPSVPSARRDGGAGR